LVRLFSCRYDEAPARVTVEVAGGSAQSLYPPGADSCLFRDMDDLGTVAWDF
jgi:hypothetical protein